MRKLVLLIAALVAMASTAAVAAVTDVRVDGEKVVVIVDGTGYSYALNQSCKKAKLKVDGGSVDFARSGKYVVIGNFVTEIWCSVNGGGKNVVVVEQGKPTGQTADEVAADLGLPAGSVETIDPGPVVASDGVKDTDGDGSSADEADEVTAEGATQDDAQPDAGTDGDKTDGGNDGVDIF